MNYTIKWLISISVPNDNQNKRQGGHPRPPALSQVYSSADPHEPAMRDTHGGKGARRKPCPGGRGRSLRYNFRETAPLPPGAHVRPPWSNTNFVPWPILHPRRRRARPRCTNAWHETRATAARPSRGGEGHVCGRAWFFCIHPFRRGVPERPLNPNENTALSKKGE